ncbi:MAG: Crp/Fnr family transcriptional regulator [Chloroflexi bacterium]|nr:Crp/Fnr family transcriptional regulator [Chloroflexota bacterium]
MVILNFPADVKLTYLQNCRFCAGFAPAVLAELQRGVVIQKYSAGETILVEGDPCDGLFSLIDGSVKLFKLSPTGRELILTVFEKDMSFNEVPVFDGGRNPINVDALEDCTLLLIPRDVMTRTIQRHPEQGFAVIQRLAENLRNMLELIEQLAFVQIPNRLARLLLRLPEDHSYTQEQLAARLGTVREVVSRALTELEKAGAIRCRRRRIEILDRAILDSWANPPNR